MATTYASVLPTLADFDLKLKEIPSASRANLDLVKSDKISNGVVAEYVYNAGSAKDITTVTVRRNYDEKRDVTSASLRVSTIIRETVSETGAVRDIPYDAVVAWNFAGKYAVDTALLSQLVQVACSLVFKDLVAANGLPTTATIDAIDRGVVSALY